MARFAVQNEKTIGAPRAFYAVAERVGFYVLVAYAAMATFPVSGYPIDRGLDASWGFGLNQLYSSPYKFGRDVIFTYGPLGFVTFPEHVGLNLVIALAIRLFVWAVLLGVLVVAYRRKRVDSIGSLITACSLVIAHSPLWHFLDYMLVSAALMLILWYGPEHARSLWTTVLLVVLNSLAFLSKISAYVMVTASLMVYVCLVSWKDYKKPRIASAMAAASIIMVPLGAFLFYDHSFADLRLYVVRCGEIMDGYSAAMSSAGLPGRDVHSVILLLTLIVGFGVYAAWRHWLGWEVVGCVCASVAFTVKHGVVRVEGHLPIFYGFAPVFFAIMAARCRGGKTCTWVRVAVWGGVCCVALAAGNPVWQTSSYRTWDPIVYLERFGPLFHWNRFVSGLDVQSEANLQTDVLPDEVLKHVQRFPVVVFPWEMSYAAANHLSLFPLYTMQSYSGYTHELDRAMAAKLGDGTPSDVRLLVEWNGIDGRHPLLDVPATWQVIQTAFEPEAEAAGVFVLRKRKYESAPHFNRINTVFADIRNWQEVPSRQWAVSLSAAFVSTPGGDARNILYKTEPVYVEFETDRGSHARFRVIPDVLRQPFTVNCLPLDSDGLELLLFNDVCQQRITRFRFSGDGLQSYSLPVQLSFAEAPELTFRTARPLAAKILDAIPAAIQKIWTGAVDVLNGRPLPVGTSATSPAPVVNRLEISGWAASDPRASEPFQAIYAVLGNQKIQATIVPRPDVAQYLKNSQLVKVGFNISADISNLRKGVYRLRLVGVTSAGKFYDCPNQIYVRLEESHSWAAQPSMTKAPENTLRATQPLAPRTLEAMPADTQRVWTGAVDVLNGRPLPIGTSATSPLPVVSRLEIGGWAVSGPKASGPFQAIYAILGNQKIRAGVVARPDVAQFLRNSQLVNVGFSISADTSNLRKGVYRLRLVGVTSAREAYDCPNQVYVRLE